MKPTFNDHIIHYRKTLKNAKLFDTSTLYEPLGDLPVELSNEQQSAFKNLVARFDSELASELAPRLDSKLASEIDWSAITEENLPEVKRQYDKVQTTIAALKELKNNLQDKQITQAEYDAAFAYKRADFLTAVNRFEKILSSLYPKLQQETEYYERFFSTITYSHNPASTACQKIEKIIQERGKDKDATVDLVRNGFTINNCQVKGGNENSKDDIKNSLAEHIENIPLYSFMLNRLHQSGFTFSAANWFQEALLFEHGLGLSQSTLQTDIKITDQNTIEVKISIQVNQLADLGNNFAQYHDRAQGGLPVINNGQTLFKLDTTYVISAEESQVFFHVKNHQTTITHPLIYSLVPNLQTQLDSYSLVQNLQAEIKPDNLTQSLQVQAKPDNQLNNVKSVVESLYSNFKKLLALTENYLPSFKKLFGAKPVTLKKEIAVSKHSNRHSYGTITVAVGSRPDIPESQQPNSTQQLSTTNTTQSTKPLKTKIPSTKAYEVEEPQAERPRM